MDEKIFAIIFFSIFLPIFSNFSNNETSCPKIEESNDELLDDGLLNITKDGEESSFEYKYFTLSNGRIEVGKTNILTAGKHGPLIVEDRNFFQEFNHFDRERIPERVVHARGHGAFGYFEPDQDSPIKKYTKARLFFDTKRTPIVVRFSTEIGSSGSADTVRDLRGFAVKFKTKDGNWDLVGLNQPAFPVRDPMRFPNLIHATKGDPINNLANPEKTEEFQTFIPENMHSRFILFSDLGTPASYRHMNGYSINTFKLVNKKGQQFYVRWTFTTDQGIRNLTADEATRLAGEDPSFHGRDLFNAIKKGNFPSWTFWAQIVGPEELKLFPFNPLDATKSWPFELVPLTKVGKIVLNRNPKNFFAEVEQSAFCPGNLVSGMEPSEDKILQGRIFAYHDTQSYRLGVNFYKLPINKPRVALVQPNIRDGANVFDDNGGSQPNFWPTLFGEVKEAREKIPYKYEIPASEVKRYNTIYGQDDFFQPRVFYLSLSSQDQDNFASNLASRLAGIPELILQKALNLIKKVSEDAYKKVVKKIEEQKVQNSIAKEVEARLV